VSEIKNSVKITFGLNQIESSGFEKFVTLITINEKTKSAFTIYKRVMKHIFNVRIFLTQFKE
jgi:hypothetical protein